MAKLTLPQQALVDLKNGVNQLKHPNNPYLVPAKYDFVSTNGITKAIIEYIDLRGGWATRASTEGRYIESLGKRVCSSVKRGTPDIIGVLEAKPLFIEVKNGSDRMSDIQIEVQLDIVNAGGNYCIAKSFDSFYYWIINL